MRYRFPTDGDPAQTGKSVNRMHAADPVRFRNRQYSLDERRGTFSAAAPDMCMMQTISPDEHTSGVFNV
jgi:hypothetical protein